MLILDSNHTHDHVLAELRCLAPLLPVGSFVLVADTLVEEFPEDHFEGRPWGRGDNPLTAVRAFLAERDDYAPSGLGPARPGQRVPRRGPAPRTLITLLSSSPRVEAPMRPG